MSAVTQTTPPSTPTAAAPAVFRNWKASIALTVFALGALFLFIVLARGTNGELSTFQLSQRRDLIQLPDLQAPTLASSIACAIILAMLAGYSILLTLRSRKVPLWLVVVFAAVFMVGFLTWAASGSTIPVPGLFVGTVTLSVPLIFGALGGVISERSGVVNVAIEGQLLAGAFSSALVASVTGNPYLGLLAAAIAGVLVAFVLAAFSIKYIVDQVIVGVVLNVLVVGLTSFFFSQVLS